MKFTEQVKSLVTRGEVQEASANILEDTNQCYFG